MLLEILSHQPGTKYIRLRYLSGIKMEDFAGKHRNHICFNYPKAKGREFDNVFAA